MSDDLDPLRDIFHLSSNERKALKNAASIIDGVSSIWGIGTTVKTVLTELGLLPDSNPVQEMRDAINLISRRFEAALSALDQASLMRDIAEQLSYSREALQTLDQFAPEEPSSTGTSAWDAQRALLLAQSARVVIALGDRSYWQRLFFPQLLYSKWPEPYPGRPWIPSVPPILSDSVVGGLVFDHRLALPAYVEAITIRLTILAAVVKDPRVIARDELTRIVLNLESYLTRIRAGIVYVFVPPANIKDFSNIPQNFISVPNWIHGGALLGAVEIYSAFDRVEPWPREFPVTGFPTRHTGTADDPQWTKFLVRWAVRSWVRWKQVFNEIGLGAVARIIVRLKTMAELEPATIAGPTGDYSIRELAQTLHDVGHNNQWGGWPVFEDEQHRLPNPISMRHILKLLQTYRPEPYTSIREALAQ
ncbi:hypothetical protein [Rhizobium mongolense]|uniref:hypothetical protein n=1 Tax=Rhizobium mongolense TaxID=57676 RepID=UPI0034A36354